MHPEIQKQLCYMEITGKCYRVADFFDISKDLPVIDVPVSFMDITLVMHYIEQEYESIKKADSSFPVLLYKDTMHLIDGRHRVVKALVEGRSTIKAIRIYDLPDPIQIDLKDIL